MRELPLVSLLVLASLTGASCGKKDSSTGSSGASSNSSSGSTGTSAGSTGSTGSGGGGAACETDGSSTLPGVSIAFTTTDCTYTLAEAAAGITIPYTIVVANDLQGVYPAPQDGGGCGAPGPSGLIPFAVLAGGSEKYCICDEGLCAHPSAPPVTLVKGSYPGTFTWDGRNWTGPSDFNNPKGAPFPPGDYTLTVSAIGQYDDAGAKKGFNVTGTFVLHLLP